MDFKLCLNLGTINHLDYEAQLRVSSQAGFSAVGLHMIRLEEYLYSGHTLDDAADALKRNHLEAAEVVFMPDWVSARGKEKRQVLARAEYICSTMERMESSVLIANTLGEKEYDPALAQDNFGELCGVASKYGVLIALEYLPWTSLDTMRKAWNIVRAVNLLNGGIVLDTFHYFKGHPSREELDEVPIEKIFIVHLDDLEDVAADLVTLTRRHRVAPGEGIFNFDEILEYLFSRRYKGYYSLEILNTNHPTQDPIELATRLRLSTERLVEDYGRKFEEVSPPGPGRGKY
jgi:sugar phosphate isomerase/epimerase